MPWTCPECGREFQRDNQPHKHQAEGEEAPAVETEEGAPAAEEEAPAPRSRARVETIEAPAPTEAPAPRRTAEPKCTCPTFKGSGEKCKLHPYQANCVHCGSTLLRLDRDANTVLFYKCNSCNKTWAWNIVDNVLAWREP